MQTHKAKRVEITIEAVMQNRLNDALHAAGASVRLDVRPGDIHEVPETALPAIRSLLAG